MINSALPLALAIDIGATKIAAAAINLNGEILERKRVDAPATLDPEEYFEVVLGSAEDVLKGAHLTLADITGIGCGCGGPMVWPSGEVSPQIIPAWHDFPLRDRLLQEFDNKPVFLHNDAVALAVGEHWLGSARKVRNLIAITISSGVGSGLILDDRLFHGKSGNAGHIGHVIVDLQGPPCKCGGRGCLQAIASGPNSVDWARSMGWNPPPGETANGVALARSAESGDKIAIQTIARAGSAVGTALASAAHLLDLDAAVIAGGFSRSGSLFWDALFAQFNRLAPMRFPQQMKILPSTIWEEACLYGAAAFVLMPDRYGWSVP